MFSIFSKRKRNRNREIFRYWNGSEEVGIDPLSAVRALHTHPEFNAEIHPVAAGTGDSEAIDICLRASREVFGVEAWREEDGKEYGLTEIETIDLIHELGDWLNNVKKNSRMKPIGPAVMAQATPATNPEPPMNAGSDSGSTSPDPNLEKPPECSRP